MINAYFKETNAARRLALLQQLQAEHPGNPQVQLLSDIYNRRYAQRKGEQPGSDYFLRSIVLLLPQGAGPSKLDSQLTHDLFINDIAPYGEQGRQLLYREYCNSAAMYIQLCLNDRFYGSMVFGMMPLPKKRLWARIEADIEQVCQHASERGNNPDIKLFCSALQDTLRQAERDFDE